MVRWVQEWRFNDIGELNIYPCIHTDLGRVKLTFCTFLISFYSHLLNRFYNPLNECAVCRACEGADIIHGLWVCCDLARHKLGPSLSQTKKSLPISRARPTLTLKKSIGYIHLENLHVGASSAA